ncbi:MAG: ATP-grasp fold amidoligase family protein [Christensenellales bacterium]
MNIKRRGYEIARWIFRRLLMIKDYLKGKFWLFIMRISPQTHANHEMKRQNQQLIRKVDLNNPQYFNEKLLWIKYNIYNHSKVVARCYNKYFVRDYVIKKGLENILNELYGAWDSIDEVPWNALPEEYVLKISNGYGGHYIKKKGMETDPKKIKQQMKLNLSRMKYRVKSVGDLFVYGTKQKIICERMLHSNWGLSSPEDYKFHCFHGEPKFVEILWDRFGDSDNAYNSTFVNLGFEDRHELEGEAHFEKVEKPSCFDSMIEIARILSNDFPYVRVDLYCEKDKPVFGELTFTPYFKFTSTSLTELGDLIHMEEMEEYKRKLIER